MAKKNKSVERIWSEQTDIIRKFIQDRPLYQHLCEEVAYILKKKIKESNIEYSSITYRAKSLDSFCEKIDRKNYEKPLVNITDIAGVRIVFLYQSDKSKIEEIIEKEFKIIEKVDKIKQSDDDRFGYVALHYLLKIGKTSIGARYDDIKELTCELQVRSVLQDAWSIIAHHLSYKQESAVPKELRRKLNSLSGLFETADDQFDKLRDERKTYIEKIKTSIRKKENFSNQEINFDTIREYLKWRFPDRLHGDDEAISKFVKDLQRYNYLKISQIEEALEKGLDAFSKFENECYSNKSECYDIGVIRHTLRLVDENYAPLSKEKIFTYSLFKKWHDTYKAFRHLVK